MPQNSNPDLLRYEKLQKQLKNSPTAYGYGSAPTKADVSAQREAISLQNRINAQKSAEIKRRWYGEEEEDTDTSRVGRKGVMSRALHALSSPLYGVVGAAESLTGEGTVPGVANIAENIREGETFGDLLRKKGAPNIAAMPLGLALDIAFDPITWATAGTSAFIPRVGYGAAKAGVEGAVSGLKSGLLSKAETVSRFIPGATKAIKSAPEEAKAATGIFQKISQAKDKISTAAEKSREAYNKLTGRDIFKMLDTKRPGEGTANVIREKLAQVPGGKQLLSLTDYSSQRDIYIEKMLADEHMGQIISGEGSSSAIELLQKSRDAINMGYLQERAAKALGRSIESITADEALVWAQANSVSPRAGSLLERAQLELGEKATLRDVVKWTLKKVDSDAQNIGANLKKVLTDVGGENLTESLKIEAELDEFLRTLRAFEIQALGAEGKIGVGWIDDIGEWFTGAKKTADGKRSGLWVRDVNVGKKIVDGYSKYINSFKLAKVAASPAAYPNAIIGNVTMGWLAGLNMLRPEYFSSVIKSWKMLSGTKDPMFIYSLVKNKAWKETFEKYPDLVRDVLGTNALLFKDSDDYINTILKSAGKDPDGIKDITPEQLSEIQQIFNDWRKGLYGAVVKEKGRPGATVTQDLLSGESAAQTSTLYAAELYGDTGFRTMVNNLEKSANAGNPIAGLAHKYFTKPMDWYSRIDQSFKLGTAWTLTVHGIPEKELLALDKLMRGTPGRIGAAYVEKVPGRNLYRIHPEKALEIVQEIYMNYAAMPGAVRLLRQMPLIGGPFASFMYGMATKIGKTAMYNPSAFNKMQFALKEMQGERSPLEKEQLQSKYYSRLNSPGTFRLPFFKENPVYLNLANMIPYYSLNIFQPTERSYNMEKTLGGEITKLIDSSPFFKTPEGQVMMDYFIIPTILKEANPRGTFDQPLYPTDATGLEKSFYAARQLAEAGVPSSAALLGLVTPEAMAEYIPSFRWRQLARAKAGKTSLGTESKTPALELTAKTIASMFGFPFTKMDLTYTTKKKSK